MRPRCSASASAGAMADSGSPVRSVNRLSAKPSRRRSAFSMNSKGRALRVTSSSLDTAWPAPACAM